MERQEGEERKAHHPNQYSRNAYCEDKIVVKAGRDPALLGKLLQEEVASIEFVAAESEEKDLLEEREKSTSDGRVNEEEENQGRSYKARTELPDWDSGAHPPEESNSHHHD